VSDYEINEVRVEGDTAWIILRCENDGFAVSIPYSQLQEMTDKELEAFLQLKVQERLQLLSEIEKKKQEDKTKRDSVKHLIGKKIKIKNNGGETK